MGLPGLWLFLLAVVAGSIGVAVLGIWLAGRARGGDADGDTAGSSLSPFLTTVALVYGALLGFTVVVAWEQFSSAEATVSNEASTLTTMYQQTVGMAEPQQRQLREALRRYTASVSDEWDDLYRGDGNEAARGAITDMYRVLASQPSDAARPLDGEFLKQLAVLASDRNARFLDARPRIPGLLWVGLLFGGVLLIALMTFSRFANRRVHLMLAGSVAVLLGLLLFIVFWLDRPFGRELGVTPTPFADAVLVYDAVDRGG
jgi:hypothetical protein